MTYVSWAALYEGATDELYFDVLFPRLMETIVTADGIRNSDIPQRPAIVLGSRGRSLDDVAGEICATRKAFVLLFIHADVGGRALEVGLEARSSTYCRRAFELCGWSLKRCIAVTPRHETEAWILTDPLAVTSALGYNGNPSDIGLPNDARAAERLPDPKATLEAAVKKVRGRRRRSMNIGHLYSAIAQRQSFDALRASSSFRDFEFRLRVGLADIGCIACD
jgi:hypothetical protein